MANPQAEDGHTDIAHKILEALARFRIKGQSWQVLCVILRKTYGFKKKEDWIAGSQFMKLTGLNRQHVHRSLKRLLEMNIVTKKDYRGRPTYSFQKDYDKWKAYPKKVHVIKLGSKANHFGFKGDPKLAHTKENVTKENVTNNKLPTTAQDENKDFEILAKCAVKLGFGDNGFRAVNAIYKKHKIQPQFMAWIFSRLYYRRYAELEPVNNVWAFLQEMVDKRATIPSVAEGGDKNYFREEITVTEYCNKVLGK